MRLTDRSDRRRRVLAARTLSYVLDEFIREHVRAKSLRTSSELESLLDRHVRPVHGRSSINERKRSEIVALLDDISSRKLRAASESYCGTSARWS